MKAYECGVCWHVYEPTQGDDVAQVPPGTDFEALPTHWRCPRCDAAKERFMPLGGVAAEVPTDARVEVLVAEYRHIAQTRMRGLPILNPGLDVEAVGFRQTSAGLLGALVTPWSINAVLFPDSGVAPVDGHERMLPGGGYRFLPQQLERVGRVELSSLFSPVFQFDTQRAAVAAAEQALAVMLTEKAPAASAQAASPSGASRRELFTLLRRRA